VVRRAGLWIFTLSFAAALPSLVGSGGTPRANAVVPSEPDAGASLPVTARGSDLLSADPAARACAARELGARGVESIASVPGLVTLLADDTIVSMPECIDDGEWHGGLDRVDDVIDRPTSPAREASRALSRIGAAAVEPLVAALGDVRATMRRYAVIALGLIDDHTVVKPAVARLETTLGDSDWQVRRSAVWALAGSGDASTFGAIAGRLKDDYPRVREMAARGLGRMEDHRATPGSRAARGTRAANACARGVGGMPLRGDVRRTGVGDRGPVQPRVAPEGLVIYGGHLDQRALGEALGELVALRRERWAVLNPAGERGRDGHDCPLGLHLEPSPRVGRDPA